MLSWLKSWWVNFWGLAKIDPKVVAYSSQEAAHFAAVAEVSQLVAHSVIDIAATGSMAPLIPTWGAVGVLRYQPVAKAKLGTVAVYNAAWYPKAPMCHRLVQKDALGFIGSGDANSHSEPMGRITEANYIGELVTLYTWPKGAA
jgi:hypothetical protein